jgi:hypothetical protein
MHAPPSAGAGMLPPISSGYLVPVEAEPMAAVIAYLRAVISNNEVKNFGGT